MTGWILALIFTLTGVVFWAWLIINGNRDAKVGGFSK